MVDDLRNDPLLLALRDEYPPIDAENSDPTSPHAQQVLNRILATPPARNRRPIRSVAGPGPTPRARRLLPGVAAVSVVIAGVVIAVGTLTPGSHPAGHSNGQTNHASAPKVRLAAWTVTRQADGNISVTIRELQDPAGLQSTLRADGVQPASPSTSCSTRPASPTPVAHPVHQAALLCSRLCFPCRTSTSTRHRHRITRCTW